MSFVTITKYSSSLKYLSYGFDIVFDPQHIKNIDEFKNKFKVSNNRIQLCNLTFSINTIIDNKVIINHASHTKELCEKLNEIEIEQNNNGKTGLYVSSLFCSLVSILRYISINDMLYKFTDSCLISDENYLFKFNFCYKK